MAVRAAGRADPHRPTLNMAMASPDTTLPAIAADLQRTCLRAGLTVATAESCTGGLIAHAITSNPGSSSYFVGGIVSYSDAVKRDLLGVPAAVLAAHGAVSAQAALAMATGVLDRLHVDLAVAVTGVAGPDGGSDQKPVGLVYVGIADRTGASDVRRFQWDGDRAANIDATARAALSWLAERATTLRPAVTA
jgi:PncC family amidohydrolase